MTDCLKCSYKKGEEKGARVCKKCGRPENVPKGQYIFTEAAANLRGLAAIADVLGLVPEEVGQARPTPPGPMDASSATGSDTTALLAPPTVSLPASSVNLPAHSPPEVGQARPLSATIPTSPAVSAVPSATVAVGLPAHSSMGGSAAHRFLNCSGSTALIAGLKLEEPGEDPDYRRDGTQAHEIGARCLDTEVDAWELVHEYNQLDPQAAAAVQVYIDYVRSLSGRRRVELKLHLPELHPLMFSTLDAEVSPVMGDIALEIVDYKHGIGVFVPVEGNDQLQYYACMSIMDRPQDFDDTDKVRLTVAQPRVEWADPIRSWDTTVGELKRWLYEVLLPAMRLEAHEMTLQLGEWCRFCPAKLICPAMRQAYLAFKGETNELAELSSEVLGRHYQLVPEVKMYINAVEQEVKRRLMERQEVPGTKLVYGRANRVWKDDAPVVDFWHEEAFVPPMMRSPAQIEKLPEGKVFVSEWAYAPEAGLVVALASDPKKEVVPAAPEEKYGDPQKLLDAAKVV